MTHMKKILISIIIIAALTLGAYIYSFFSKSKDMIYGVSFNPEYASYLGFEPKLILKTMLDEWRFKYIRLTAQWDRIEKIEGEYDFSELDWQMDEAALRGAKVLVALGRKTPRWPECHLPEWAKDRPYENYKRQLLNYMSVAVNRYKNHPALEVWQVENEPFLAFGLCRPISKVDLQDEINTVRRADNSHPIMVTDSGELSFWTKTARAGDLFGTTMYRVVWNPLIGYFKYFWLSPFVYKAKLWLNGRALEQSYIVELQGEPWMPDKSVYDTPLQIQARSMSLKQLEKNLRYAERTGMPRAYLWGGEWWYWLASKGHREIVDYILTVRKE
ncbi:hypothetical protein EPN28_03795 [Patescibacteria group bacterium]|nr:MAG: hypothetical protein EPN28_03795 [Patescibacteria group bacterium]